MTSHFLIGTRYHIKGENEEYGKKLRELEQAPDPARYPDIPVEFPWVKLVRKTKKWQWKNQRDWMKMKKPW